MFIARSYQHGFLSLSLSLAICLTRVQMLQQHFPPGENFEELDDGSDEFEVCRADDERQRV